MEKKKNTQEISEEISRGTAPIKIQIKKADKRRKVKKIRGEGGLKKE